MIIGDMDVGMVLESGMVPGRSRMNDEFFFFEPKRNSSGVDGLMHRPSQSQEGKGEGGGEVGRTVEARGSAEQSREN